MTWKYIPYGGWDTCVRLTHGPLELIVTKEVGPRVIRFGFIDGPNEFAEYPDQAGLSGGSAYRSYGGHRLWIAPETIGWTDHPDNEPVELSETENEIIFTPPPERGTGIQKHIAISFDGADNSVRIRHRIRNTTDHDISCALWGLSVMAPGGTAIVPHEPYIPHAEKVLPAAPIVLWHYTDMSDDRWTWGEKFTRLRQSTAATSAQKFGVRTSRGWAAYHRDNRLFLKRFPLNPDAVYPDFGCNAEIFTNSRMLEIESLGPLLPLPPGATRDHTEQWLLFQTDPLPASDNDLETLIATLLR
jgi:hypothetical protein